LANSIEKHDHLEGFVRTANISWCHQLPMKVTGRLQIMDFYLSREYFTTIQSFYVADQQDDISTYADIDDNVYGRSKNGKEIVEDIQIIDPEYQCVLDQFLGTSSTNIKLKGMTYYYKNPTMEDIYPELAANEGTNKNAQLVTTSNGLKVSPKERLRKLQQPPLTFTGFAAKFVNMSPKPVLLYWDGKGGHEDSKRLVGEILPFESIGTATTPGQSFHVTPVYDSTTALQRWVMTADTALVYYEPTDRSEIKKILLDDNHDYNAFGMYQRQLINQAFARDYLVASGRTWLGQFPRRYPMHYMHPAEYIGQEHTAGGMKLKVASVTPRVLTIDNFLTEEECHEIIRLGVDKGLKMSTLHSSATARQSNDTSTRSSSNTWLPRDTSSLTEKIYQKAAALTNIDPELFQKFHETSAQHHSIAESLQVVRYRKGEEYTPHHDFVSPPISSRFQGTRFATLLIYLNTVTEGGETRFPRAVNNYNAEGLEITPKAGSAVLFYNILEDGNVDDLSQHGSNKVTGKTNKWMANLWVSTL
jgi:prolyl 4-hydroxylase